MILSPRISILTFRTVTKKLPLKKPNIKVRELPSIINLSISWFHHPKSCKAQKREALDLSQESCKTKMALKLMD